MEDNCLNYLLDCTHSSTVCNNLIGR